MSAPTESKVVSVDPTRLRLTDREGTTGILLGMRCRDCGIYVFGAALFCQSCSSGDLESVELSGRGILYSFTIVRVPPAGWPGPVPYVLGEVELPEGPHILAEVTDIPEADLKIGLAVAMALQKVQDGQSETARMVYKWRPIPQSAGAGQEEAR